MYKTKNVLGTLHVMYTKKMGYTVSERMRHETRVVNNRSRLGLPNCLKPHSMVSLLVKLEKRDQESMQLNLKKSQLT